MTCLISERSETVDTVALIMVGMPDEDRIDLMLKISDFYKEQAKLHWPDLSLELVTRNRRNFVVAIMRRTSEFDAATGSEEKHT
jgi:hypothetical protein